MDEKLKHLKDSLDTTLLKDNSFSDQSKRNILHKLKNAESKNEQRNRGTYWLSMSLTAIGIVIFTILIWEYSLREILQTPADYSTNHGSPVLSGDPGSSSEPDYVYNGELLTIGVIGDRPTYEFDNITFVAAEPASLKEEHQVDAYFISDDYFEELSQEEWASVLSSIPVPVFFLNLDFLDLAFREEHYNYENKEYLSSSDHSSGFAAFGTEIMGWGYGDRPSSTNEVHDTPEWIFHSIFRDIELFSQKWTERLEYRVDHDKLFTVFPDPYLVAGKEFGYMISFAEPFETYEGKQLSIHAFHKETGEAIMVVPPETITEPSSGYPSLNRYVTSFELPSSGHWKLEFYLNDEYYGDAVIYVGIPAN